jgi:hypothetical protein
MASQYRRLFDVLVNRLVKILSLKSKIGVKRVVSDSSHKGCKPSELTWTWAEDFRYGRGVFSSRLIMILQ